MAWDGHTKSIVMPIAVQDKNVGFERGQTRPDQPSPLLIQDPHCTLYPVGELGLPLVDVGLLLLDLRAQEGLVPLIEVQRFQRLATHLQRESHHPPPNTYKTPTQRRRLQVEIGVNILVSEARRSRSSTPFELKT